MKNPLFPHRLIDQDTIRNYNKCLVITPTSSTVVSTIFDKDVEQSYFDDIKTNYEIHEVQLWMIRLILEYKKKFVIFDITEDDLLKFNFNTSIIYNLNNAIILIPNHPWNWFAEFIEPYMKDGIQELYKYVLSNQTLDNNEMTKLMKEVEKSYDVTYWSDINKCKINITTPWLLRDINFSDAKEIEISKQKLMDEKCNDYLTDIINKNRYVDASSGIKTHKHNLYYINEYSNLPIDLMITKLLIGDQNPTQQKLNMSIVTYGLLSKKYVHRLLKNEDICLYIKRNFSILSKSFAYSWLMMYLEEGIKKSHVTYEDRCVFTLDQAKKLPHSSNVYLPLLIEKSYINIFGGYQSNSNSHIELSDIHRFRNRLEIFSNNNNIDVFKNFNWKNIAISGSVIAAASRHIDPLEKDGSFTTNEFFNTYYKDSDIDVMCDAPDYVSFIDKITYMIEIFKTNILNKFPLSENPIQVEITKNVALQLTKKYVDEYYNGKISPEDAYKIYITMKSKEEKQTNSKYYKINEVVGFENFKYYIYDNQELKEPTYGENIKYHISSPHLTRKFEVFKIKYNFMSTVSRFHLPCVRGYYDGNQVYLLPSAISALLTNKCIDYKYFAGVRSPFEIILKYIFRGYSIFFNKREMIKIVEYIKNSDKWKNIFKYNENFKINTFQSYYSNPFVLLNKENINYYDYRKYIEQYPISPIVSTLGYVIPLP